MATALHPTVGTVKPSAILGKVGVKTGVPAFIAVAKLGHLSGSTPYNKMDNFLGCVNLFRDMPKVKISIYSYLVHNYKYYKGAAIHAVYEFIPKCKMTILTFDISLNKLACPNNFQSLFLI